MLSFVVTALFATDIHAQQSVVDAINSYGDFDSWSIREVKESSLIGGATEQLYEFYGNQETTFTGKTPFKAPDGYLWRTNNVLAIVAGVVKTNNTVYPEKRGDGYCARIETHIEEVKALGVINMDVTCRVLSLWVLFRNLSRRQRIRWQRFSMEFHSQADLSQSSWTSRPMSAMR